MKRIKVAIADDHPIVSNGLKKVLADFPHFEVVAVFTTGNTVIQGLKNNVPDVLVLDMQLPDMEGPEIARAILKTHPTVKILVLSSTDVLVQVKKMLQIGCMGYLLKDSDDMTIVKAIETVYDGGQFLAPGLQQRVVDDMFKTRQAEKQQTLLTRREKEVLQLILQELTNQEIANKLFISLHTVDNHRSSLLQKLNVKNTAGLVKKAIETGIVEL